MATRATVTGSQMLSGLAACLCVLLFSQPVLGDKPSFETAYAQIMRVNCLRCHNTQDAMGGLDLSTRKGLLKGGDTEPAIVVGKPDESLLIQRAAEGSMPPISDGDQLTSEQVELLRGWIEAGATWEGPALRPPLAAARVSLASVCHDTRRIRRLRTRWRRQRR